MNILDYLDTIRTKPEVERRRILAIWTALGMIIIVGLWLGNMLFVLPTPEPVTSTPDQSGSVVVTVRGHIDRIVVGFGTLKTVIEDMSGLRDSE